MIRASTLRAYRVNRATDAFWMQAEYLWFFQWALTTYLGAVILCFVLVSPLSYVIDAWHGPRMVYGYLWPNFLVFSLGQLALVCGAVWVLWRGWRSHRLAARNCCKHCGFELAPQQRAFCRDCGGLRPLSPTRSRQPSIVRFLVGARPKTSCGGGPKSFPRWLRLICIGGYLFMLAVINVLCRGQRGGGLSYRLLGDLPPWDARPWWMQWASIWTSIALVLMVFLLRLAWRRNPLARFEARAAARPALTASASSPRPPSPPGSP